MVLMLSSFIVLSCAIVSSLWKRFGVTSAEQLAMCVSREPVMGCHSNEIHKPVQERDSRNVTSQELFAVEQLCICIITKVIGVLLPIHYNAHVWA